MTRSTCWSPQSSADSRGHQARFSVRDKASQRSVHWITPGASSIWKHQMNQAAAELLAQTRPCQSEEEWEPWLEFEWGYSPLSVRSPVRLSSTR